MNEEACWRQQEELEEQLFSEFSEETQQSLDEEFEQFLNNL